MLTDHQKFHQIFWNWELGSSNCLQPRAASPDAVPQKNLQAFHNGLADRLAKAFQTGFAKALRSLADTLAKTFKMRNYNKYFFLNVSLHRLCRTELFYFKHRVNRYFSITLTWIGFWWLRGWIEIILFTIYYYNNYHHH